MTKIDADVVLTAYLGPPQFFRPIGGGGGYVMESSLSAALRDCRNAQGRDGVGRLPQGAEAASWLGAVGYLCVLDQLDSAIQPKAKPSPTGNFGVLNQFLDGSAPTEPEVEALYGLRCALAHDYSLLNEGRGRKAELRRHIFQLSGGPDQLLKLPRSDHRWDGVYGDDSARHDPTVVSLPAVGDLVEKLVASVRAAHVRGEVEIACPGGAVEMSERYFFRHNDLAVLPQTEGYPVESPRLPAE